MTAAQRDWLLRTRVPVRDIRFHRFEAASSALVRWVTSPTSQLRHMTLLGGLLLTLRLLRGSPECAELKPAPTYLLTTQNRRSIAVSCYPSHPV